MFTVYFRHSFSFIQTNKTFATTTTITISMAGLSQAVNIEVIFDEGECTELVHEERYIQAVAGGCANLQASAPPLNYSGPTYQGKTLVERIHQAPRFGGGNNIAVLTQGSDQDITRYRNGLLAASIICWIFFGLWTILLIYARCRNQFGWLGGIRAMKPQRKKIKRDNNKEMVVEPTSSLVLLGKDDEGIPKEEEVTEGNVEPVVADAETLSPPKDEDNNHANTSNTNMFTTTWNNVVGVFGGTKQQEEEEATPQLDQDEPQDTPQENDDDETATEKQEQPPVAMPEKVENEEKNGPANANDGKEDDEEVFSMTSQEADEDYARQVETFERHLFRARICVLLSGVLACVFSALLIGLGFFSLGRVISSTQDDIPNALALLIPIQNITGVYVAQAEPLEEERIYAFDVLNETCNFDKEFEIDYGNTTVNASVNDILVFINETLNNASTFVNVITAVNDGLISGIDNLMSAESTMDSVQEWWYIPVGLFIIIMDLMAVSFMIGVILEWKNKQPRLFRMTNNRCVFPIFCFLLGFSYLISTICLIISQVLSDYCINTPDDQIMSMADAPKPFDKMIAWYTQGCKEEDRPLYLLAFLEGVVIVGTYLGKALDALAEASSELDFITDPCGGGLPLVSGLIRQLAARFDILGELFVSLLGALSCKSINTLYSHLSYDTLCNDALTATSQIFVFLFLVAFFCMMIVTTRVAWQDFELEEQDDDEEEAIVVEEEPKDVADDDENNQVVPEAEAEEAGAEASVDPATSSSDEIVPNDSMQPSLAQDA